MIPIDIGPGVTNSESRARNTTNWREVNSMRWEAQTLLPIPGWEETPLGPFASKLRQMHRWMTNNRIMVTAFLCEEHLYIEMGETILIDITPVGGIVKPSGNNGGYGDKQYNYGAYGTKRPGASRLVNYTPIYTLDNWGDQLRAMTSPDGRLLMWDPATPTAKAVAVPNAPLNNRTFVITPERHVMLFGMDGKPDQFGWCDEEDDSNWNFSDILSKAGYYDLEPSSPIVAVQQFFAGVVMFTMVNTYLIRFQGMPYIYGYFEVGRVPVPLSQASLTTIPEGVLWPSLDGFWMYTGSTILPVECPIWDWIKRNTDFSNTAFQAYTVNMSNQSEIWWNFVGNEKEQQDNSRTVIYDHRSKWWSMGKVGRSCGFVYGPDRYPICSDGYKVWRHGYGFIYPGSEMPWAETFTMNLGQGEVFTTVNEVQPEIIGDRTALEFSLFKQYDRTRSTTERQTPARKVFADGRVQFRETAKDFRMRIQMVESKPWSVGPMLIDAKPRGKKVDEP